MRICFLILLLFVTASACIWDSDTIDDELRGVPDQKALVTNRWYRHGTLYYEERVQRLEAVDELTLDQLDDLAIGYERLKQRDKSLAALERKRKLLEEKPDSEHQYRYHANRGTILAHSGRYKEALEELKIALELNPDAHFGRERYQVMVIEYLVACKEKPELWREHNCLSFGGDGSMSSHSHFEPSIKARVDAPDASFEESMGEAKEGLSGMLRFGGIEGAELYRALGDVSMVRQDLNLAWYYYRWAIEKNHPASDVLKASCERIEEHWDEAELKKAPIEAHFISVKESSHHWLRVFHRLETESIKNGEDPSQPKVLSALIVAANQEVPLVLLNGPYLSRKDRYYRGRIGVAGALGLSLGRQAS